MNKYFNFEVYTFTIAALFSIMAILPLQADQSLYDRNREAIRTAQQRNTNSYYQQNDQFYYQRNYNRPNQRQFDRQQDYNNNNYYYYQNQGYDYQNQDYDY